MKVAVNEAVREATPIDLTEALRQASRKYRKEVVITGAYNSVAALDEFDKGTRQQRAAPIRNTVG